MANLAPPIERRITAALEVSPCGRCGKEHMLKKCPMGAGDGYKGGLWADLNKPIRTTADQWLKAHPSYSPQPGPPAVPKASKPPIPREQAQALSKPKTQQAPAYRSGPAKAGNPRGYSAPSYSLEYQNPNPKSDMYYPTAKDLDNAKKMPTGIGRALDADMDIIDRSKTLKTPDPKYPLRQRFFLKNPAETVLTNHFEYKVDQNAVFHEYRILDLGTKNRKKLRKLVKTVIEELPCLKDHGDDLATNHVDTIVAWKSLHGDLQDGKSKLEDGVQTIEWGPFTIPDGFTSFNIRLKLVKTISPSGLSQYALGNPNYEHENFDDIARCLNIAISKSFGSDVHKLSSSKFFVKHARVALTNGNGQSSKTLEIIRGYFYNVKPGMGNIILNFNISTSAVYRPILVADFFSGQENSELNGKGVYVALERYDTDKDKQNRLNSEASRYLNFFGLQRDGNIEDLKFRKKKVNAKGEFIKNDDGEYQMEDHDTFVVDHLEEVFRTPVQRGRRGVNVGSRDKPTWYAQEHLRVVPYQPYTRPVSPEYTACMVREACRKPEASRAYIENEGLHSLGFETIQNAETKFKHVKNFPITLYPAMLEVPRLCIAFPKPEYRKADRKTVDVQRGGSRWQFPRQATTFITTAPKQIKYAVIAVPGCDPTSIDYYNGELRRHITKCGVTASQFDRIATTAVSSSMTSPPTEAAITAKLRDAKQNGANLVVLILPKSDLVIYRDFKNAADRVIGLQSICLVENFKNDIRFRDDLMINVMMKMNLKLGGVNHGLSAVAKWLKNTMVLGGDLIHPGPGSFAGTPCIASIVGSVDQYGGKCLGSMRLQDVHKTDREIMDPNTVEAMVIERLEAWAKVHTGKLVLPENIIFYRDGVSSGHYPKVQDLEVKAIRNAFAGMQKRKGLPTKKLNLATIIVTKRHHTRFYPISAGDKDQFGQNNCKPGTCVDQLVTSPYYQDFYLQSHSGIKGTARPTHYFVLNNNVPGMTLEEIRDLTNNLCYSYVRSMTAVSYASPTYYADRLCERGRLYIRKFFNGDDEALAQELYRVKRRDEDQLRGIREREFGTGMHQKGKRERDMEKEHLDEVKRRQKDYAFDKIKKAFYGDDGVARNPWSENVAETMFWM